MMLMVRSVFIIPENAEKGFILLLLGLLSITDLNVFFCPAVFV